MDLPKELAPYRAIAEEYITENRVGDVEFSGATYQVQVIDFTTDQDIWVFIQLDKSGKISDSFCSCEGEDESGACAHVAVAYLYLFGKHTIPLHQRFSRSLWHFLCALYGERSDYSVECFTKVNLNHYIWLSPSGKLLFDVKALKQKGSALIRNFIVERSEETEETSLKFSNLTPEEIELWRSGKPSAQLKFELSFWNDIAKWMMVRQERGEEYQIDFILSAEGIPNWIHINCEDLDFGFYISRARLPQLIPYLQTVDSSYKVYGAGEAEVGKVTYDQERKKLHIEHLIGQEEEEEEIFSPEEGIDIGNWIFVPEEGFYAKRHHSLMAGRALEGEEITWALEEHLKTIQSKLQGVGIYEDPVKISYAISFDKDWNLLIDSYLFQKGDMNLSLSQQYGSWFYIQDDGFYFTEENRFNDVQTVIFKEEVVGFIVQNRSWLNTQEGFHTFLANVETQLIYRVDEEGKLWFESSLQEKVLAEEHYDFGSWVYVPDAGFYQKSARHIGLPVAPGSFLEPQDVAPTIRMYLEELKQVKDFFSEKCPIKSSGLHITLTEEGKITHFLHHEPHSEYALSSLRFYGDYVYLPGNGFHILPLPPAFPREYVETVVIPTEGEEVFIHFDLPYMKELASYIDPRLKQPGKIQLICEEIDESRDSGWYESKLTYQTDVGKISASHLWRGIQEKKQFLFTEGGIIELEDDRFRWLRTLNKERVDLRKKKLTLSSLDILRLNAYDTLESKSEKLKEITAFELKEEPNIEGLKSHLRPYQENGVKWLWYLYQHNLSGLLCDDMGLGKTHQAMALIAAVKNTALTPKHFLVVCPTSVIYHWQDKLHTFFPNLRVLTFYGQKRSMKGFQKDYDLLLTSYGIWRKEYKLLKEVDFEVAFFDEIQMAKNRRSKLHKSLSHTTARFRLGLTGTPIENNLQELKSLFDIVLPGYMPGEEEYKNFFVKPIEKQRDLQKQVLLNRFVNPFILRRKKEEVLTDLPEKIEEISYCALLPEQKKHYQTLLISSKKEIIEQLDAEDKPIPYVHVFALLSKLKQVCNHPAVLFKEPENYKKHSSGKWDLFIELLNEARESRQKVVIFSQYLAQLDIIQTYLQENQIKYAGIRGSTTERGKEIERFHKDEDCEVFVASLQAAGLGIDLTAASVVIHYDRWWNAARENQATDRVHRIGQSRGVQVFKLVTRGTFEEKIHEMIERKGKLMEDVIGMDDQQMIKQLDRKEILELLQDVHLSSEDQQDVIQDID